MTAVEKSGDHRGTLQGLHGKTVAECRRGGGKLAPAPRQQRFSRLRQFRLQLLEQADTAQEFRPTRGRGESTRRRRARSR